MQILLEQKTISGYIIFIHKSYNEIVDEIVEMRPKTKVKSEIFGKLYLTLSST